MPKRTVTMSLAFRTAVNAAVSACAATHLWNGGRGVCCYVWVTGPAEEGGLVRDCFSSNGLDLEKFDGVIKGVPGYSAHYVNID